MTAVTTEGRWQGAPPGNGGDDAELGVEGYQER
jgi:hypothetical protein